MENITPRRAIGLSVLYGPGLFTPLVLAETADPKKVTFVDDRPVLFKVKHVTLNRVDQATRTIKLSFGPPDRPTELSNLPLGEDIKIRVSFVFPGSVNNLPFDWDRPKGLVGKRISIMLRAESSKLSVESIATAND